MSGEGDHARLGIEDNPHERAQKDEDKNEGGGEEIKAALDRAFSGVVSLSGYEQDESGPDQTPEYECGDA